MFEMNKYGIDEKDILIANESYLVTMPAQIGNAEIAPDENGRKIIKQGTALKGDLLKRDTALTKGTNADAVAILLHNVDVTDGNANGTIVIAGAIDVNKLGTEEAAAIDSTMVERLPSIIFVKGV